MGRRDWLVWKSQIVFQYRVEGQNYGLAEKFLLNWSVLSNCLAVSFKDTKWVYCLEGQNNFISIFKCLGKIPNRKTNWTRKKKLKRNPTEARTFFNTWWPASWEEGTAPKCLELHRNSKIFITPRRRIIIIYSATIMCQAWVIALKITVIQQEKLFYAYFIVVETKVYQLSFYPNWRSFSFWGKERSIYPSVYLRLTRPNRKPTRSYL